MLNTSPNICWDKSFADVKLQSICAVLVFALAGLQPTGVQAGLIDWWLYKKDPRVKTPKATDKEAGLELDLNCKRICSEGGKSWIGVNKAFSSDCSKLFCYTDATSLQTWEDEGKKTANYECFRKAVSSSNDLAAINSFFQKNCAA
jgi:hypothetical protein